MFTGKGVNRFTQESTQVNSDKTGRVRSKWQRIQHDYTCCSLQGHDLLGCWILHPEHRPKKEERQTIKTKPMKRGIKRNNLQLHQK